MVAVVSAVEIACRIEQQQIEHNRVNPTERWANCVYVSTDVFDGLRASDTFSRVALLAPGWFKIAGLTVIHANLYRTVMHDEIEQVRGYVHVTYNPEFDR